MINEIAQSQPSSVDIPTGRTNWTLTKPGSGYVFGLAVNTVAGTSGLTPTWICVYDSDGIPAAPQILNDTAGATSLTVRWSLLVCGDVNRVRVVQYDVVYRREVTGW